MVRWDLFCFVTCGTSQPVRLYSFLRHIVTPVIQSRNSLELIYQVEMFWVKNWALLELPLYFVKNAQFSNPLWEGLFWEEEGRRNLSCSTSIIYHLLESSRGKVMRHFIKFGHLCWQYNNGIQISLWKHDSQDVSFHFTHLRFSPPKSTNLLCALPQSPGRLSCIFSCLSLTAVSSLKP